LDTEQVRKILHT